MKVFANGFPKTGNHGLVHACELLGIPATVNHRPYAEGLPEGTTHHLHIIRDPRNVIVSMLRFNRQPVNAGTFLSRFRMFQSDSLIQEMREFEPWFDPWFLRLESLSPSFRLHAQRLANMTLTVRWEDLVASDATMRQIAEFVGTEYIDGAFDRLPSRTFTWNQEHSDFRKIWTKQVGKVWTEEGGDELLKRWGYEPWNS